MEQNCFGFHESAKIIVQARGIENTIPDLSNSPFLLPPLFLLTLPVAS